MLHEIITNTKLGMRFPVFNHLVSLKKCLDLIWVSARLHRTTNIVIIEVYVETSLILHDHVVENHTNTYDIGEACFVPINSRTLDKGKLIRSKHIYNFFIDL